MEYVPAEGTEKITLFTSGDSVSMQHWNESPETQNVQDEESGRLKLPRLRKVASNPDSGSVSVVLTIPYKIARFTESKLEGLTANSRDQPVEKTADEFESTIDEVLTQTREDVVQATSDLPEKVSSPNVPWAPDPILSTLILPPTIESVETREVPPVAWPLPIPGPAHPGLPIPPAAWISPPKIVRNPNSDENANVLALLPIPVSPALAIDPFTIVTDRQV
jgi:hypothetical protein